MEFVDNLPVPAGPVGVIRHPLSLVHFAQQAAEAKSVLVQSGAVTQENGSSPIFVFQLPFVSITGIRVTTEDG